MFPQIASDGSPACSFVKKDSEVLVLHMIIIN